MLRPIAPGDAGAVAAIARAAQRGAIPGLPDLHSPEEDVAFFGSEISTSTGHVWTEDAVVVGFVLARGAWVTHLYVRPGRQRAGIGARLLARALGDMARTDSTGGDVRLWTFQANTGAVAFYRSQGFRILESTDGAGNEERLPDHLMGRTLGPSGPTRGG